MDDSDGTLKKKDDEDDAKIESLKKEIVVKEKEKEI